MIMGLDRYQKTPCGFCFVEFHHRESTEDALRLISGCKLDERIIRVGEAPAPGACAHALPLPRRRRRCSRCASCAASPCADWDGGFVEGRQYGRGRSGGQVSALASTLTLSLGPDPKPRHLREHSPRASLSRCSLMAPRPDLRPELGPGQVREEYRNDYDAGRGGWGLAGEQPAMPLNPPRRRSFDPGSQRGPRGSGGHAPELASISQGHGGDRGDDPPAKRAKPAEVKNQRFREEKDDDEDDDD